jgi:hypothetical protein
MVLLKVLAVLPTLAITWPLGVLGEEDSHAVAVQVHGDVILLFTLY